MKRSEYFVLTKHNLQLFFFFYKILISNAFTKARHMRVALMQEQTLLWERVLDINVL